MRKLLLALFVLFCQISWAQSGNNEGIPKEGTYQVIVTASKVQMPIARKMLVGMEEKRKLNESVSIIINENAYLYLPSKKEIKSSGFKELEPVVYE